MKIVPKVQNWEVLDDIRSEGNCLRNYHSVGLLRGWEDILIGSIDRKIKQRQEDRLKEKVRRLRKPQNAPQVAA